MNKNKICFFLSGFFLLLAGCSSHLEVQSFDLGSKIVDRITCQNFRSKIFDSFYLFLDQNQASPVERPLIEGALQALDQRLSGVSMSREEQQDFREGYRAILRVLSQSELSEKMSALERTQWLIELETGSVDSQSVKEQGLILSKNFSRFRELVDKYGMAKEGGSQCPPDASSGEREPTPQEPSEETPAVHEGASRLSKMAVAGHFAFATLYQSCEVLKLPEINAQTPDLQGVAKDKAVDSVGWGRKYTNIPLLQKTHPYLNWRTANQGLAPNCRSVREAPPVYDYGGVPKWDGANSLNFFVNSGSGGPALGIDCSALISSAIGQAGLRYQPGLPNKAIYSRRTSKEFLRPEASKLTCFDRIVLGPDSSIAPGDIMAINGHVVMIDRVGVDPFGVSRISKASDCSGGINLRNFDFAILQSSPSKNSIGVNRFTVKDYLEPGSGMATGFQKYAVAACLSHLDGKKRKLMEDDVAIIRHKGTPECLSTQRVEFVGAECVQRCQ